MGFPVFDMPFAGNPILIAVDAIVHVVLSHGIAIGAVTFIVVAEWVGWRDGAPEWETFARRLLKPTAIAVVAIGAPTGVGIWLITSVIAPRGIASLLRVFFWPWFIEWMVFTGEVILLLLYAYTWRRWTGALKRRHVRLGFTYVAFSVATALIISGILGFMLTPDGWPWQERLANAFLNPSYPPQLLVRLGLALLLGSLYAVLWLAWTEQDPRFRARALVTFGRLGGVGAAVVLLAGIWYLRVAPSASKAFLLSSWGVRGFSQAPAAFAVVNGLAIAILLAYVITALSGYARRARAVAIAATVAAIALVAEFEFVRESARKPYLMPGYMYANQILTHEVAWLQENGLLKNAYWYNAAVSSRSLRSEGAYLFLQNCSRCHAVGGFNDIRERLRGRPADGIYAILGNTRAMVPFMPPFAGTSDERRILSEFLSDVAEGRIPAASVRQFTLRGGGM